MNNIFAYTVPTGNYPAFISVNKVDDFSVEILVRTQGASVPARIVVSNKELLGIASNILDHFGPAGTGD